MASGDGLAKNKAGKPNQTPKVPEGNDETDYPSNCIQRFVAISRFR